MTRSIPAFALFLAACGGVDDENDAALCSDRADNDKDGLVDCMEPGCAAFCQTSDTGTPRPTVPTTPTDTDTDTDDTTFPSGDTGSELVHLTGTIQIDGYLNPANIRVELLGSGQPAATTDAAGNWALDVLPGTYPWRMTPPVDMPLPETGTELTVDGVRTGTSTTDTGIASDQVFDVLLAPFIVDVALPMNGAQPASGLLLTVSSLTPVAGEAEAEGIGGVLASTPLPIEGVQDVHLMYYLRPFGHLGTLDIELIYLYDPDMELWGLDPVTGRWQSFGGFTDLGDGYIAATQTVPWVTTLAVVTP